MAENEQTFEEKLQMLEQIVGRLEKGDVPLEQALSQFETGVKLTQSLQKTLEEAQQSIAKIVNEDGTLSDFQAEG